MRFSRGLAVLLFGLSLVTSSAWAAPILTLQQGTSAVKTIYDTDGDGIVTFAGTIGSYVLNFTAGKSTASTSASTGNAVLDLFSFDLKATFGADPLTITLMDSNFSLPGLSSGAMVTAEGSVNGSMLAIGGGKVSFQSQVNNQALYAPIAQFSSNNFSATASTPFLYLGPFSLFSQAVIKLNGPGAVLFNQSVSAKAVPEPGSLGLLAVGLLGARALARRRAISRT